MVLLLFKALSASAAYTLLQHADSNQEEQEQELQHSDAEEEQESGKAAQQKPKLEPGADSLQTLKRQLAAAKGAQAEANGQNGQAGVPIEWGRVLTAEDFERIKQLRHRSALPSEGFCFVFLTLG